MRKKTFLRYTYNFERECPLNVKQKKGEKYRR